MEAAGIVIENCEDTAGGAISETRGWENCAIRDKVKGLGLACAENPALLLDTLTIALLGPDLLFLVLSLFLQAALRSTFLFCA